MIKVAEEFYRKLYSSNDRHKRNSSMETMNFEVYVCTSEIEITLRGMNMDKAGGTDGLSIVLLKDASDFLQDKLAIIILIEKKET